MKNEARKEKKGKRKKRTRKRAHMIFSEGKFFDRTQHDNSLRYLRDTRDITNYTKRNLHQAFGQHHINWSKIIPL